MSRHTTDEQESAQEWPPSPPLPADHVLNSGAVLFPGAFDQHGCPLIVFPVDGQAKLSSELSKAEVVDFINYFMFLHNKRQEKESLVSVVADLRHSSLPTTRFIAETLVLLELHKQTVHTVYIIQPKKKAAVKLLLKLLAPSKSLKKVLLKEVLELSNYIDRSQLTAPLGGYLIYCHKSWVAFIKEMDAFVKDFLSVVQRLPSCISTLHTLSRLPLPSTFNELQHFCSTNEAKFQQLRRELGLDELLRHCESVVEKLRYPESEPCYQAMAGTALFTQTTFDMLQNHSRITAAVEKVDLLWHQAFSKARLQLQVLQLREDALQTTEQIHLLQEKLASYKIEIAKDAAKAVMLVAEFEASIYTPAVALVRSAEDVIHTLAEILPFDGQTRERWVLDLERLKENLHSAVHFILQTLRAVSSYHHYYSKASRWYSLVLCENFLQELLSGVHGGAAATQRQRSKWGTIPQWRRRMSTFLKKNPSPDREDLVHLAHLSNVIPDEEIQLAGKQMSERCMTLRKLLISSGPVAVGPLQQALQWQYELLRGSHVTHSSSDSATNGPAKDGQHLPKCEGGKEAGRLLRVSPSSAVSGLETAEGKPASLSSFDSGFDGAGSSPLEAWGGRGGVECLSRSARSRDSVRPALSQPQIHKDSSSSVSDSDDHREEFDFGSVGNSSRASIQIIPKVTVESLNFEIKVKRSAALPSNPWLSLPVDDLESSYTVTITQNPTAQKRDPQFQDPSEPYTHPNLSSRSRDQPTQTEVLSSTQSRGPERRDWTLDSQSGLEDPELSPICNVLSSTITEGGEKSSCTTEGIPTLLWDSYDLHDQNQDTVDGLIDLSMKDWDVREQEGLKEVEKILDRADEILEKEEEVLAQEAVLDALLRTENSQWPPWDSDNQLGVMSSSELAEAGVLGLEDYLVPIESDDLSETGSAASVSAMMTSDGDRQSTEATPGADAADAAAFHSRPDLLTELRKVHVLDELIMEENMKIHKLRRCEENSDEEHSGVNPLDMNKPSSVRKEKETFRLQLEKEKREVDNLEKSLDKECKVKKHKDRVKKVKSSRIENKEDRVLHEELRSGSCDKSQQAHSTSVLHIHSQDTCNTQHAQTLLGPYVAKEASAQVSVQPQDSQSRDHSSEAEPSAFNRIHSDLKAPPQELGIQLQRGIYGEHVDRCGENAAKPEASLTPETRPDDGAFDPGGEPSLPPVPQPRKAPLPPSNDDVSEPETLHSTEPQCPALPSDAQDPGIAQCGLNDIPLDALPEDVASAFNANVRKHSTNNNNNCALPDKCAILSEHLCTESTKNDEDVSSAVIPDCAPHMDLHQAEETQTSSTADQSPHGPSAPQLPLQQTLSHAGDELDGDLPSGSQRSEVIKVSGSQSPGIQAQLNISLREMTDFKTPIVLDTGSGLMKAGFANQDLPNIIFPTIIGMPKYEEIMNGSVERETYIGHEAQHMRGVLALKHPIKNGIIRNWDEMEKIWHHTFQQLGVDPDEHPVLLTEAAMNPLENRQRMVEIMFECFSVPFTYVAMQAVLALYAAGRSTGVVFDSGDGVSHSVPVFEGYCLPHAVQRFPLAGVDVTMQLKKLLQEQGVCMRTTAELEIVREMKEKCCRVALNYEAELSAGVAPCTEIHYTMPDGQTVTVATERFRAPEILFKPELIGQDHYGMHESIFKSILSSDIDLRRCFLGNIILSGGNTLLSGLPERLQAEIRGLVPSDMGQSVRVTSPNDRDFSVWSGGAVLANLPTFSAAWISQDEYEEYGPQIVFRKCF